jgi:hypothetical protein
MAMSERFHAYTLAEIREWPMQPRLIPGCLIGSNLAAVTGDPDFFCALRDALGPRVVSLVTRRGDRLTDALAWMEPYRGSSEVRPARLVYVEPKDPIWDAYWLPAADLVLDGKTAALARVVKVRDFPNSGAPLLIEAGVVRLAGRATAERS